MPPVPAEIFRVGEASREPIVTGEFREALLEFVPVMLTALPVPDVMLSVPVPPSDIAASVREVASLAVPARVTLPPAPRVRDEPRVPRVMPCPVDAVPETARLPEGVSEPVLRI